MRHCSSGLINVRQMVIMLGHSLLTFNRFVCTALLHCLFFYNEDNRDDGDELLAILFRLTCGRMAKSSRVPLQKSLQPTLVNWSTRTAMCARLYEGVGSSTDPAMHAWLFTTQCVPYAQHRDCAPYQP